MSSGYTRFLCALALLAGFAITPAAAQDARVQVIHNAADPAAAVVDVYIEEVSTTEPAIPDFAFRTATPYLSLPANTELTISVAPGNSSSAADALASFPVTLLPGATYSVVASGVLDPEEFHPNPNGRPIGFTLLVNDDAPSEMTEPNEVQISIGHGATDAPAVGVEFRGVGTLSEELGYGDITEFTSVPAQAVTVDLTIDGMVAVSFGMDLTEFAGSSVMVLASGFLAPAQNQNGEDFGLLTVSAPGVTAFLPPLTVSNEADAPGGPAFVLSGAYPNPVTTTATVRFTLETEAEVALEVFDVLGRRVLRTTPERMAPGTDQALAVDAGTLPAGVYVFRLTAATSAATRVETGRLTVVR